MQVSHSHIETINYKLGQRKAKVYILAEKRNETFLNAYI